MINEHRGIGMTSERTRIRLVNQLKKMGIKNPDVLEAIKTTPRHVFVDEALASRAYENTALPIGYGQTISQPYIVARMTEVLIETGPLDKVLEIGAGSGYQTVILDRFAGKVYAIERIISLTKKLREKIQHLRLPNILVRHGDGLQGWPENGPYDAILSAAAPASVPPVLLEQLKTGGRLILPVGVEGSQNLKLITRVTEENYNIETLDAVSFVPMREGTV